VSGIIERILLTNAQRFTQLVSRLPSPKPLPIAEADSTP
jgi:hypothetical protein